MNSQTARRSVVLAAAAALLLAPLGARAIAIWPSMPGMWNGFSQSSLLPAVQLPAVQFEVSTQSKGRFAGEATLAFGDGSVRFFCDGSVQPNPTANPRLGSVVNIRGISTDGLIIAVLHGKSVAMGDGSVRLASLRYQLFSTDGGALLDTGYLLMVQAFGGPGWVNPGPQNDPTGSWAGPYTSAAGFGDGSLMADLVAVPNSAGGLTSVFTGPTDPASGMPGAGLTFQSADGTFQASMLVQGTVGLPAVQMGDGSLASPFAAIGTVPGNQGVVGLLIGLLVPADPTTPGELVPAIRGQYTLFGSEADVFNSLWYGRDTSLGRGSFAIQQ